jgi:hypothetical protein
MSERGESLDPVSVKRRIVAEAAGLAWESSARPRVPEFAVESQSTVEARPNLVRGRASRARSWASAGELTN